MDDIRDCVCECPPNRHLLERVGTLVAVSGECVDCPCPGFEEKGSQQSHEDKASLDKAETLASGADYEVGGEG